MALPKSEVSLSKVQEILLIILVYPTLDFHVSTVQTPYQVSVLVYKGGFVM